MVVETQGRRQTLEHNQAGVKIPSQALTVGTTEESHLPSSREASSTCLMA